MSRVMVLIVDDDDNHDIWDVFDVQRLDWTWAGIDQNGSRGRITIEGSFKRRHTTPASRDISARMRKMLER